MTTGEFLTKLTVWLALTAYAWACAGLLSGDRSNGIRIVWSVGCAIFLAHVACAFGFHHGWSHADAYRQTARQTAAMTGMNWGGGLYFNYLFAALWLGDVVWWWLSPSSHARRARLVGAALHGFLFFLVVNGAVVFVRGPMKAYGLFLCVSLLVLWWRGRRLTARGKDAI